MFKEPSSKDLHFISGLFAVIGGIAMFLYLLFLRGKIFNVVNLLEISKLLFLISIATGIGSLIHQNEEKIKNI